MPNGRWPCASMRIVWTWPVDAHLSHLFGYVGQLVYDVLVADLFSAFKIVAFGCSEFFNRAVFLLVKRYADVRDNLLAIAVACREQQQ